MKVLRRRAAGWGVAQLRRPVQRPRGATLTPAPGPPPGSSFCQAALTGQARFRPDQGWASFAGGWKPPLLMLVFQGNTRRGKGGPEPRGLVRRGPRRESQTASVRGQDPPWQGTGSGWGWAPAAVPAESLVPAGGRGGRVSCGCGHKRPRRRWLRQRESSPTAPHVGIQGGCRQARSLASWGRAVRGAFPPGLPGFGRRHGPRLPAPPPSAEPAAQPPCACPVATAALWSPHPRLRVPLSRTPGLRLAPTRGPGEKPHLEVPTLITATESLLRKVASSQVLEVGRGPLGASLHPP